MILDDCYASFVNLDSRPDRLKRMLQSLKVAGVPAERTRGMLPEECTVPAERIKGMLDRPQKGAIGCHFSQVSVMEKALGLGKHAFVLEDDLVFCLDFQKRMEYISAWSAGRAWDIIWLGATFHVPGKWHPVDAEVTDDARMIRTYGIWSTYAYIVNRNSIGKVLGLMERELPKSIGIDYLMIQIQPELRTFCFVPGCVKQYDNQSNIGRGVTRFSGFAQLGAYWYAERMEDFEPKKFKWK